MEKQQLLPLLFNGWILSTNSEKLRELYNSDSNRYYHNASHIDNCLKILGSEAVFADFKNNVALRWAILYHDVVYDPKSKTNEEDSAKMAIDDISKILNPFPELSGTLAEIHDLILSTKHQNKKQDSELVQVMLDIDLSILGSSEQEYREYSNSIRKEYSFVSEADYAKGRTNVLQSFLDRDMIYYRLKDRETTARKNIKHEIMRLSGKF